MVIGVLVLLTGDTTQIILIAVFGALTLYVLAAAAVIKLRIAEPDLERPYKTPLYPFTPIAALVFGFAAIAAMIWNYPMMAAIYAAIVVASCVLFELFVPVERRTSF
jgi:ethanolamine permease